MMENPYSLNINQIQHFLPHRSPFLLIDRILEIHPALGPDSSETIPFSGIGTKVVALKNVTFNEPYFLGHFPGFSIVPGVLLIETMAQTASFSIYPSWVKNREKLGKDFQCILVGVDKARFRKPVTPGDTMKITSEVIKNRGMLWGFRCSITVEEQRVAEAEILANLLAHSN